MNYREHYDTLADRIKPTRTTYLRDLVEALAIAALVSIPMVLFFWSM
jgi:hypothetical protein